MSLPTRERGLKPGMARCCIDSTGSLPTRERGLKQVKPASEDSRDVAPHAGAWIETGPQAFIFPDYQVAPHAGAWIETFYSFILIHNPPVAPHAGAWIETDAYKTRVFDQGSLPTRERGLKHICRYPVSVCVSRSPRGSVD